jgi:hypothetical protein
MITSPATGATFTAPASITIQATVSAGASVNQVDFFANDVYLASATGSPYSVVRNGLAAWTYSLTARAVDRAGLAAVSSAVTVVVGSAAPPLPPPPASWSNQDVGAVGRPGSTGVAGTTWAMTASGSDIWSTADAFQFAYQTLAGDGSITARVASLSNINEWTKAGVMMREI